MTRSNWILLVLVAVLAVLIFFAPQLAWQLRTILAPQEADTGGDLPLENAALRAELAKLQNIKSQLPEKPWNYTRAVVLSRYPLNFKNEFLVDTGRTQGVEKGEAVAYDKVLIGRIENVFENSSLVKTVFDSGFQTAVRVGSWASDALFKGGLEPKLILLPLNAPIKNGDIVYSASPDFPYGLPVGEIKEVSSSVDKLFQEAELGFAYDINEIRTVFIAK